MELSPQVKSDFYAEVGVDPYENKVGTFKISNGGDTTVDVNIFPVDSFEPEQAGIAWLAQGSEIDTKLESVLMEKAIVICAQYGLNCQKLNISYPGYLQIKFVK